MWNQLPFDFSDTVRVRVFSADPPMSDMSDDYFTIAEPPPFIDVLVPNGGEQWHAGGSEDITWFSYGTGNVNIHWSPDNFMSEVYEIANDEINDHIFTWDPVSYTPDEFIRIRVESTDDPLNFDISSNDFSIVEGGWATSWGTDSWDEAEGIAVDSDGYAYVTGDQDFASVDKGFLRKFDPAGLTVWELSFGGDWASGYEVCCYDGYVYVLGCFNGTDVDFDPGPGTDLHTTVGEYDAFLTRFDSDGTHYWTVTWGGINYDWPGGIAVTSSGVYVSGDFPGSVDFDPDPVGTDIHTSAGSDDAFLSEFDLSGDHIRTCTWGGTSNDGVSSTTVDVAAGRIYLSGYFYGTSDFDPDPGDTVNKTSTGESDAYLLVLDNTFDFQNVYTWGGPIHDGANSLGTVSLGNIYVTGTFSGTDTDLDPGTGESLHTALGPKDIYLTCFNQSLEWQWTNTWGGTYYEDAEALVIDPTGNVIVVGDYQDVAVDFDPGPGEDIHPNRGQSDGFWSKFDSSGNHIMTQTWGGSGWEEPYDIACTPTGSFYICGYYDSGGAEFAPVGDPCFEDSVFLPFLGEDDIFLVKYLSDGCW